MRNEFPLRWPEDWSRIPPTERQKSRFSTGYLDARDGLARELKLLGATDAVLTTNLELRLDGLPYTNQQKTTDPGVSLYFTLDKLPRCVPCDVWDSVTDNIQAIRKTIEALRGIERWGAGEMMNRAFRGFAGSLPNISSYENMPWWQVLGVPRSASRSQVEAAFRQKVKLAHPDLGGDDAEMRRLTRAILEARSELVKGAA